MPVVIFLGIPRFWKKVAILGQPPSGETIAYSHPVAPGGLDINFEILDYEDIYTGGQKEST
jgi:hypothetical protein